MVIKRPNKDKDLQRSGLSMLLTLIAFFSFSAEAQKIPMIRALDDCVVVGNIDREVLYTFLRYHHSQDDWNDVFPVRVKGSDTNIAGSYTVGDSSVTFSPRFPFAPEVEYHAIFFTGQLAQNPNEVYLPVTSATTLSHEFKKARTITLQPEVTAIFPSADNLPENLLRFHILFSTPMTRGDAYKFVTLRDEYGVEVEKAFLVVDEEMWNEEMTSLTLLLDPGRIKRGLKSNLEMQAPLIEGKQYTLEISPGWKNVHGRTFASSIQKKFTAVAADRDAIRIERWQMEPPRSSKDDLIVRSDEPLDFVLAQQTVTVEDDRGNRIDGSITISEGERLLIFTPAHAWNNQQYRVCVDSKLEDLAGNNLKQPFDRDLSKAANKSLKLQMSFVYRPVIR